MNYYVIQIRYYISNFKIELVTEFKDLEKIVDTK